jgi:hypothetical protein
MVQAAEGRATRSELLAQIEMIQARLVHLQQIFDLIRVERIRDADDAAPTAEARKRADAWTQASAAKGIMPDEVDTDALGGMGILFFGSEANEATANRRVWVACLNRGSTVVSLTDERGRVSSLPPDAPDLWEQVKAFLGR